MQSSMSENGPSNTAMGFSPLRRSCSKSVLCKLSQCVRKPFRVMVLGQAGVGKSALTVRFITRRFIGDYDPTLEDIYTYECVANNELVCFQILDSGGHSKETEHVYLESNIRWAEAFILMYSITDKCSFDECIRLKFFINLFNKRRRTLASHFFRDIFDVPVVLVGNKADQGGDRMISTADGEKRCHEIGCVSFHEISVRESIDAVYSVFEDVHSKWKAWNKTFKYRRPSSTETETAKQSPQTTKAPSSVGVSNTAINGSQVLHSSQRVTSDGSLRLQTNHDLSCESIPESFRDRACTDGSLQAAARWRSRKGNIRYATTVSSPLRTRRMSISMRGSSS